jgi:hypothetical protein
MLPKAEVIDAEAFVASQIEEADIRDMRQFIGIGRHLAGIAIGPRQLRSPCGVIRCHHEGSREIRDGLGWFIFLHPGEAGDIVEVFAFGFEFQPYRLHALDGFIGTVKQDKHKSEVGNKRGMKLISGCGYFEMLSRPFGLAQFHQIFAEVVVGERMVGRMLQDVAKSRQGIPPGRECGPGLANADSQQGRR